MPRRFIRRVVSGPLHNERRSDMRSNKPREFRTATGEAIPFREWRKLGRVSVAPWSGSSYRMRNDATGETTRPIGASTPAGADRLAMALYRGVEPTDYAHFCFGNTF